MNTILQNNIYSQLKSAVSGETSHVYFLYLPSTELLEEITVVYELNNSENEDTFDSKEATKIYGLRVQINAPTSSLFGDISIYIKAKVYNLVQVDENVKHVKLLDEQLFYDDELKVFTEFLRFEIQYHYNIYFISIWNASIKLIQILRGRIFDI